MAQRWTPDTCPGFQRGEGCCFEITHDPVTGRQIVLSVISKCADHAKYDDFNSHKFAHGENQMKNKVIAEMAKVDPSLNKKDENGNDVIDSSKFDHSFDEDRKLSVFCKGKVVKISLGEDIKSKVAAIKLSESLDVD